MEPGCLWLSAPLPVFPHPATSPGSDQLQIGPTHAFEWLGLGKRFKRKPKSVSHFAPYLSTPLSFFPLSFTHTHIQTHTHTAVIWLLSSELHFSSWSWFMTFPLQTHGLWCSLCSSFSGSQTQTHTRIQHNLIFSCSVLSLCSLPFLTFPCRHAGRVLRRLVILKAKKEPKKKSHMHVPCVSSLGRRAGVGGQLEERKREKNKRGGVKGSIS